MISCLQLTSCIFPCSMLLGATQDNGECPLTSLHLFSFARRQVRRSRAFHHSISSLEHHRVQRWVERGRASQSSLLGNRTSWNGMAGVVHSTPAIPRRLSPYRWCVLHRWDGDDPHKLWLGDHRLEWTRDQGGWRHDQRCRMFVAGSEKGCSWGWLLQPQRW